MWLLGSEFSEEVRKIWLIAVMDIVNAVEIEPGPFTKLRQFMLYTPEGERIGMLYEDYMPRRAIENEPDPDLEHQFFCCWLRWDR